MTVLKSNKKKKILTIGALLGAGLSTSPVVASADETAGETAGDASTSIKAGVQKEIEVANDFKTTDEFKAATSGQQSALESALTAANSALSADADAQTDAINNLQAAIDDINSAYKADLISTYTQAQQLLNNGKADLLTEDQKNKLQEIGVEIYGVINDYHATKQQIDEANNKLKTLINDTNAAIKAAIQPEIDKAEKLAGSDKFQAASEDARENLTHAIATAEKALDPKDPTDSPTTDFSSNLSELHDAEEMVDTTAKAQMNQSIALGQDMQANAKYNAAKDESKKKLDDSIKAAQDLVPNRDATMAQINDAKNNIDSAITQVDKDAKSDMEQALNKANTVKGLPALSGADEASKNALTRAITTATKVDQDQTATMDQINTSQQDLKTTIKNVSDSIKAPLLKAIAKAQDVQTSAKYNNAPTSAKTTLDSAITSAQQISDKEFPEQDEITGATASLNNAINNLDYAMKSDLRNAIVDAQNFKNSDAYKSAIASARNVFDSAFNNANMVSENDNANKATIDNATDTLRRAMNSLTRGITDTLRDQIGQAQQIDPAKITKAGDSDKHALEAAIQNAQNLSNNNSTDRDAINGAITALTDAENKIDQDAKSDLKAKLSEAKATKASNAFTNANSDAQAKLEQAISNAEGVDGDPTAKMDQINSATKVLEDAIDGVSQSATGDLNDAIAKGERAKSSDNYKNADGEATKALTDALNAARNLAQDGNATKEQLMDAEDAITKAIDNINQSSKRELKQALDQANQLRSSDRFGKLGDLDKNRLTDAIDRANRVMSDDNAPMTDIENAQNNLDSILKTLANTQNADLTTAINNAQAVLDSPKGDAASNQDKQALAEAINDAKRMNTNNPSEAVVTKATDAINNALKNLDDHAKGELRNEIEAANNLKNDQAYPNADQSLRDKLTSLLNDANAVNGNTSANKADIDTAAANLKAQISAVKEVIGKAVPIDKSGLDKAINDAEKITSDPNFAKINQDTQKAVNDALTVARTVGNNGAAKQSDLDQAAAKLTEAIGNATKEITDLKPDKPDKPKVDKSELQKALTAAEKAKKSGDYQNAADYAKQDLDDAISDAQSLLKDDTATETDVTTAIDNLNSCVENLKTSQTPDEKLDKTDLNKAIQEAEALEKQPKYLNASDDLKTELIDALSEAQIQAKNAVSQSDIDDATENLQTAMESINAQADSSASSNTSSASSASSASSSMSSDSSASSSSASTDDEKHTEALDNLNKLLDQVKNFKNSDNYKKASKDDQENFDNWFDNATRAAKDKETDTDLLNQEASALLDAVDNMVHTSWVDNEGNELKADENGVHPDDDGHSDISGYTLLGSVRDDEMNVVNIYAKDDDMKPKTYFFDSQGNQIQDPAIGTNENAPDIKGYKFLGSYSVTDKDVAEGGQFAGTVMKAGDVIDIYQKDEKTPASSSTSSASSSASSANSNISSSTSSASSTNSYVSSSASSSSSAGNTPIVIPNTSSANSNASSAASNTNSQMSSTVSSIVSNASSSASQNSETVSNISSAVSSVSNSSSAVSSASDSAISSADSNAANSKANDTQNSQAGPTNAGSATAASVQTAPGSVGGQKTLPQTGDETKAMSVLGLAMTSLLAMFGLKKKKREEQTSCKNLHPLFNEEKAIRKTSNCFFICGKKLIKSAFARLTIQSFPSKIAYNK